MALVDVGGIAELMGVRPGTVRQWAWHRDIGFPAPVEQRGSGRGRPRLWDLGEVIAWAVETGRLSADGVPQRTRHEPAGRRPSGPLPEQEEE